MGYYSLNVFTAYYPTYHGFKSHSNVFSVKMVISWIIISNSNLFQLPPLRIQMTAGAILNEEKFLALDENSLQ
jgi:hypothetical protein